VGAALAAGAGVTGAMAATFAAAMVGAAIPLAALAPQLLRPIAAWRPRISRNDVRQLAPVVGGLLAITALSTDDVIVAKAAFSSHEAGLYGSASLIGRVVLYLPAAIVTVLLPKVSSRVAAARASEDILLQSAGATTAFCVAATVGLAILPRLVIDIAVGSKYSATANLLWLFGAAMTLYALLNVALTYQLAHRRSSTSWLLLAGTVAQSILYAFFHDTPHELLVVSIATGSVLLLANELLVEPTLLPAVRRRLAR
jgi:O-antigen/teichoic acid export membrane protein